MWKYDICVCEIIVFISDTAFTQCFLMFSHKKLYN